MVVHQKAVAAIRRLRRLSPDNDLVVPVIVDISYG